MDAQRRNGAMAQIAAALVVALVAMASLAPSAAALSTPRLHKRQSVCNGDSSLCSRQYSNVTFAGAHNSYAINSPGQTSAAANQNVSITQQLEAGTRMLQVQAHRSENDSTTGAGIDLCHTTCGLFQGGSLEYYLGQVKSWTDDNPTEVVTLLIVNSDSLPATQFAQGFQSTGLADRMWQPTDGQYNRQLNSWPTLGEMIDSGKSVVGFLASEAEVSSVPYLLDEFNNMWENSYDQTTTPFNCSIDRIGDGVSDSSSIMYISNQFLNTDYGGLLTTPNVGAIGDTNSVDTTMSTSSLCAAQHGRLPNFILTDYSTTPNYGVQRAAAQMNGVSYVAPPAGSGDDGSSSGSSSGAAGFVSNLGSAGKATAGIALLASILAIAL